MQIAESLERARQRLGGHSESARLDTELLLCSVLNCERSRLYAWPEQVLGKDQLLSFNRLVSLREGGYPIAYLIHQREFWSLSLKINEYILIPRPETEQVVEKALTLIPTDLPASILELGTGSGAIAIAIASERSLSNITATDISRPALDMARYNANLHQLNHISFRHANWFDGQGLSRYDLIISNPPYVALNDPFLNEGDVRFEPEIALVSGENGLDDLTVIIDGAAAFLNDKGWLIVEHGFQQGEAVNKLFMKNQFHSVSIYRDYAGRDRFSMGQYLI